MGRKKKSIIMTLYQRPGKRKGKSERLLCEYFELLKESSIWEHWSCVCTWSQQMISGEQQLGSWCGPLQFNSWWFTSQCVCGVEKALHSPPRPRSSAGECVPPSLSGGTTRSHRTSQSSHSFKKMVIIFITDSLKIIFVE